MYLCDSTAKTQTDRYLIHHEIATSGIGEEHAVAVRLPLGEGEEDDERLQQLLREQPREEALARLQHERQFHYRRKSRGFHAEHRHRRLPLRRRPHAAAQVRALQKDQASAKQNN